MTLEGLEGLKVLEISLRGELSSIGTVLFIILLCLGIATFVWGVIEVDGIIVAMALLLFISSVGVYKLSEIEHTIYKVTPIGEAYSIDFNKYEIIEQNGEILTLKETNNK